MDENASGINPESSSSEFVCSESTNSEHVCSETSGIKSPESQDELGLLRELRRKVDITRLNRINASNRLLKREKFVQSINIYYSCIAAVVTVLSLLYPEQSYGIASAVLTIILAISIVYLNAQKYGSRAQQLQMNYLSLNRLEFEIDIAIEKHELEKTHELQEKYVDLLQTSENHEDQDFRLTLYKKSIVEKRGKSFVDEKRKYTKHQLAGFNQFLFWGYIVSSYTFKAVLWILPCVYFILVVLKIL